MYKQNLRGELAINLSISNHIYIIYEITDRIKDKEYLGKHVLHNILSL